MMKHLVNDANIRGLQIIGFPNPNENCDIETDDVLNWLRDDIHLDVTVFPKGKKWKPSITFLETGTVFNLKSFADRDEAVNAGIEYCICIIVDNLKRQGILGL